VSATEAVIDAHIHVQPWDMVRPDALAKMKRGRPDVDAIRARMESPARFLEFMDSQGIERAVLVNYVSAIMGFTDAVNPWIARYCATDPVRLLAVGSLDPRATKDPKGDTERLFDMGIRALKIHPSHQLVSPNAYVDGDCPALAAIYAVAAERGRPVMVHTGTSIFEGARNKHSDPLLVEDVAVDFPSLRIVLCHAGRPLWMDRAVFLARRFPNVHLDISSIPPAALLEYLPKLESLADRTLWGTDWPAPAVPDPATNVTAFRALALAPAAQEKILRTNALRVFW
jgi:predicted TIM-barrel fold metal-dependent hydrolase